MDLGLDLAACQCDEWLRAADEAVVPESWFYRWRRTKYPRSPDDIFNSNQIYKRKKAIDNQLMLVDILLLSPQLSMAHAITKTSIRTLHSKPTTRSHLRTILAENNYPDHPQN